MRSKQLAQSLDLLDLKEREIGRELVYFRRKYTANHYRRWLEAMYTCAILNWGTCLDELVTLRKRKAPARGRKS